MIGFIVRYVMDRSEPKIYEKAFSAFQWVAGREKK